MNLFDKARELLRRPASHTAADRFAAHSDSWAEAFDRLSQARHDGTPVEELRRQAGAEFDRLTGQDTAISRTQPLPVVDTAARTPAGEGRVELLRAEEVAADRAVQEILAARAEAVGASGFDLAVWDAEEGLAERRLAQARLARQEAERASAREQAKRLTKEVNRAYTLDNTPRGFIHPDSGEDEWGFDDYSDLVERNETALREHLLANPELEQDPQFHGYYRGYRERAAHAQQAADDAAEQRYFDERNAEYENAVAGVMGMLDVQAAERIVAAAQARDDHERNCQVPVEDCSSCSAEQQLGRAEAEARLINLDAAQRVLDATDRAVERGEISPDWVAVARSRVVQAREQERQADQAFTALAAERNVEGSEATDHELEAAEAQLDAAMLTREAAERAVARLNPPAATDDDRQQSPQLDELGRWQELNQRYSPPREEPAQRRPGRADAEATDQSTAGDPDSSGGSEDCVNRQHPRDAVEKSAQRVSEMHQRAGWAVSDACGVPDGTAVSVAEAEAIAARLEELAEREAGQGNPLTATYARQRVDDIRQQITELAGRRPGAGDSPMTEDRRPQERDRGAGTSLRFGFVAPSTTHGDRGGVGRAVESARDAVNDMTAQHAESTRERADYDRAQQINLWASDPYEVGTGLGTEHGGGLSADGRTTSW